MGKLVAWLAVLMVIVQFGIVTISYVFAIGSIWYQESVVYMHATLFLLAAAYTLIEDGHVRVDVFFRAASENRKALTDLLGHLAFLIPVMTLILWVAYPYVSRSWMFFEGSKETSGIHAVYLLKSLILIFAVMLALQAFSGIIRSAHRLVGGDEGDMSPHSSPGKHSKTQDRPMDLGQSLDLLMFAVAVGLLMAGYPVAFTLAGTALAFAFIGISLGVFDFSFLQFFPQRISAP